MTSPLISRRDWLKLSAVGVLGCSTSGWFESFGQRRRGEPEPQEVAASCCG